MFKMILSWPAEMLTTVQEVIKSVAKSGLNWWDTV